MRRADGRRARAVAEMRPDGTLLVVWFVNDHALGYRDFDDWSQGLRWSEQLQAQNWAAGWRLAPDPDDAPDD